MNLKNAPLKTRVEYDGQEYVDNPVYKTVSVMTPMAIAVQDGHSGGIAVCGMTPAAIHAARASASVKGLIPKIHDLVGYERERLRWMRPDGNGGVVPR